MDETRTTQSSRVVCNDLDRQSKTLRSVRTRDETPERLQRTRTGAEIGRV